MYNSDIPTRAELPSSAQLIKSTMIAFVAAAVLLVTVVLPAEHAIDPTGIGRALKLTDMGEIKKQLATEAAADRAKDLKSTDSPQGAIPQKQSLLDQLGGLLIPAAHANEPVRIAQAAQRNDETTIVLKPNEGAEYKIELSKGGSVVYSWKVEGGVVNYEMQGSPKGGGKESSYKAARSVGADEGTLTAGFDGTHGWFFRNRGSAPVTVRLKTSGAYTAIKKA